MWAIVMGGAVLSGVLVGWRRSGQGIGEYLAAGLLYLYVRLWHRCTRDGPTLPTAGSALVIANHSCSADPAFLMGTCRRTLSFLVAREYYRIAPLRWLFTALDCVPVARNGREVRGIRTAMRRLAKGRVVCLFPEGGLSGAGRVRRRRPKAGAALLALRGRVPVFPALILGGPRTTRTFWAWMTTSRVHVRFGPAVDLSAFQGRRITRGLLEEVARLLMDQVAALEPHPETKQ